MNVFVNAQLAKKVSMNPANTECAQPVKNREIFRRCNKAFAKKNYVS